MFIKNEICDDNDIINVPDSAMWQICYRVFDEDGEADYKLCLIIEDKTILLRDPEYWCQGRPNLPYAAVGYLYREIVDVIFAKIENEPNLKIIDIPSIENQLLNEKYEKEWLEKGYVTADNNGCW